MRDFYAVREAGWLPLASHFLGERRRHVETLVTGRSDHLSVIQGHILVQWSTYPAEAQLLRFASMDPDISIVPLDPYSRNSGLWYSETDHSERLVRTRTQY
jgi:hypothetical protein